MKKKKIKKTLNINEKKKKKKNKNKLTQPETKNKFFQYSLIKRIKPCPTTPPAKNSNKKKGLGINDNP